MKRIVLLCAVLTAALALSAQEGEWQEFDLFGGYSYPDGSALSFASDGAGLLVTGTASKAAGYVIEANRQNLVFSGKSRLKIKVSGITGKEKFDAAKLLKLELANEVMNTSTAGMKNLNDPDYINARNGEAEFDISRLRNIRKINLVFYDCTVADVKIEVFYK
jgi:hypothetical protein